MTMMQDWRDMVKHVFYCLWFFEADGAGLGWVSAVGGDHGGDVGKYGVRMRTVNVDWYIGVVVVVVVEV